MSTTGATLQEFNSLCRWIQTQASSHPQLTRIKSVHPVIPIGDLTIQQIRFRLTDGSTFTLQACDGERKHYAVETTFIQYVQDRLRKTNPKPVKSLNTRNTEGLYRFLLATEV